MPDNDVCYFDPTTNFDTPNPGEGELATLKRILAASGGGGGSGARSFASDSDKTIATGVPFGKIVVITDEGNRVEQYVPVVATMVVSGGTQDGVYPQTDMGAGRPVYSLSGTDTYIGWDADTPAHWVITGDADYYYSPDDVATPDLCTHWFNASDDSPAAITVTRHDEANQDNWIVLRNTVNLTVNPTNDVIIVGVFCGGGDFTNVGWVYPDSIPYVQTTPDSLENPFTSISNSSVQTMVSFTLLDSNDGMFALPANVGLRDSAVSISL